MILQTDIRQNAKMHGGDMGDPIPVGDGWIFLFLLALGYGSWKGLNDLKGLKI